MKKVNLFTEKMAVRYNMLFDLDLKLNKLRKSNNSFHFGGYVTKKIQYNKLNKEL